MQFAIFALELFNKKSMEYPLLVWLYECQAAHLSGVNAFAPELQTIFNPCSLPFPV
jgi:hypothetical protein